MIRKNHPAADLFPMLPDDELDELAADIKANGLVHPVVIDSAGVVIDGRNRIRACEIAGVEPAFVTHDGDARAFILSSNIRRRHMSKGAQAMAVALMYPDPVTYKRGGADSFAAKELASGTISKARAVLSFAPALSSAVLIGATSLDAAYAEAQDAKRRGDVNHNELDALRRESPDMAAKVVDGELTLAGARAELAERLRIRQKAREDLVDATRQAFSFAGYFSARSPGELAKDLDVDLRAAIGRIGSNPDATKRGLMNLLAFLEGTGNE